MTHRPPTHHTTDNALLGNTTAKLKTPFKLRVSAMIASISITRTCHSVDWLETLLESTSVFPSLAGNRDCPAALQTRGSSSAEIALLLFWSALHRGGKTAGSRSCCQQSPPLRARWVRFLVKWTSTCPAFSQSCHCCVSAAGRAPPWDYALTHTNKAWERNKKGLFFSSFLGFL